MDLTKILNLGAGGAGGAVAGGAAAGGAGVGGAGVGGAAAGGGAGAGGAGAGGAGAVAGVTAEQQQNLDMLNQLIGQMNSNILCGPKCQERRKIERLKANYENAKKYEENGEQYVEEARKSYYTAAFGNSKYNALLKADFDQAGDAKVTEFERKFADSIDQAESVGRDVADKRKYLVNLRDLYAKYEAENSNAAKKIGEIQNITNISHRKTYYANQQRGWNDVAKDIAAYLLWAALITYLIGFVYFGLYTKAANYIVLLFVFLIFFLRSIYTWATRIMMRL
jgi:hypothetical protein